MRQETLLVIYQTAEGFFLLLKMFIFVSKITFYFADFFFNLEVLYLYSRYVLHFGGDRLL